MKLQRSPVPQLVLTLMFIGASTVAGAQGSDTRFVAPTDATVTTDIEEGFGSTPVQVIWIRNTSTVPIHVYSVTLRNCENVRQDCSPTPINLRVRPGGREVLTRVEARSPNASFRFRYSFGWRADSAGTAALRTLANGGDPEAQRRLAVEREAAAEQAASIGVHDVNLGRDDIAALGAQITRLRVEPDSVIMHPGQLFALHQVRVLALNGQGDILGRIRAYNFRVRSLVTMRGDTVIAVRAGRTEAEFRLAPPASPLMAILPIIVAADTTP